MSDDTALFWAAIALSHALTLGLCYYCWRSVRDRYPDYIPTFRLTDLWAAMLGIAPALFALSKFNGKSPDISPYFLPAAILILPSQLAGAFLTVIGNYNGTPLDRQNALSSFFEMFIGTLTGAVIPGGWLLMFYLGLLLSPLWVPILLLYFLWTRIIFPRKQPSPQLAPDQQHQHGDKPHDA